MSPEGLAGVVGGEGETGPADPFPDAAADRERAPPHGVEPDAGGVGAGRP